MLIIVAVITIVALFEQTEKITKMSCLPKQQKRNYKKTVGILYDAEVVDACLKVCRKKTDGTHL